MVLRAAVRAILTSRPNIYSEPALADLASNGGSRINDKIRQMLKRFTALYPGSDMMVREEVEKLGAAKGRKRKAADESSGSPTKSPKRTPVKGGGSMGQRGDKGCGAGVAEAEVDEQDVAEESS